MRDNFLGLKMAGILLLVMSFFRPVETKAQQSLLNEVNYEYLQKLIALAKENFPKHQILKVEEQDAQRDITLAGLSYLDAVDISYFYRPSNRAALNPDNPFVFNGFQFGASVSLSYFFEKPVQIKQAKLAHEAAKLQIKDSEIQLEAEVKARYYTYLQYVSELKTRNQAYQDSDLLLTTLRGRYENGEIQLTDYNSAKNAATQANLALMQAEVNFMKARDALEALIGAKLTDIK